MSFIKRYLEKNIEQMAYDLADIDGDFDKIPEYIARIMAAWDKRPEFLERLARWMSR
jgi:uncharacterized protein YPO0396